MHTSVDCLLTSKTEISVKSLRFSECSHSKYQSIRKHDRYMVLTDVRQSADLMFLAKSGVALLAAGGPTRPRQKCPILMTILNSLGVMKSRVQCSSDFATELIH